MGVLSNYTNVPEEKTFLLSLSKSEELYKKWKVDEYGIIDLMKELPSLMVDSSVLVYHLKPLLPRYKCFLFILAIRIAFLVNKTLEENVYYCNNLKSNLAGFTALQVA